MNCEAMRQTGRMSEIAVRRIDFGYVIVPGAPDTDEAPHVLPCLGYVIVHPEGVILFDTGIGQSAAVDAVTHVVNCHLHYDHCGGNAHFTGRPIFTQLTELSVARSTPGYTIPDL